MMSALWLCFLRGIVFPCLLCFLERPLSLYYCFLILLRVFRATPALQVQSIAGVERRQESS